MLQKHCKDIESVEKGITFLWSVSDYKISGNYIVPIINNQSKIYMPGSYNNTILNEFISIKDKNDILKFIKKYGFLGYYNFLGEHKPNTAEKIFFEKDNKNHFLSEPIEWIEYHVNTIKLCTKIGKIYKDHCKCCSEVGCSGCANYVHLNNIFKESSKKIGNGQYSIVYAALLNVESPTFLIASYKSYLKESNLDYSDENALRNLIFSLLCKIINTNCKFISREMYFSDKNLYFQFKFSSLLEYIYLLLSNAVINSEFDYCKGCGSIFVKKNKKNIWCTSRCSNRDRKRRYDKKVSNNDKVLDY